MDAACLHAACMGNTWHERSHSLGTRPGRPHIPSQTLPDDSRGQNAPVQRFEAGKMIAPARWQECRADVRHDLRRTTPDRGLSSAGRASALQAEGHRFDPDRLHQMKVATPVASFAGLRIGCCAPLGACALGRCIIPGLAPSAHASKGSTGAFCRAGGADGMWVGSSGG